MSTLPWTARLQDLAHRAEFNCAGSLAEPLAPERTAFR
jgi:hypothetical protein